jgi:hypothetical protein
MDGLVSKGNKFPYTILNIIFAIKKKFSKYFINILKCGVEKEVSKIKTSFQKSS